MTVKLRGNGEKDNHAASCCSHLPTTSKAARTQAAGNSCHPIKLNNLQVLRGSTCVQLAEQIHLLQDAGPSSQLLQFGCAPLTLWSTAKWLQTRVWLVDVKEAGKALLRSVILQMIPSLWESVCTLFSLQLLCLRKVPVQSVHPQSLPSSHLCSMPITASPCFYYLTKIITNSTVINIVQQSHIYSEAPYYEFFAYSKQR